MNGGRNEATYRKTQNTLNCRCGVGAWRLRDNAHDEHAATPINAKQLASAFKPFFEFIKQPVVEQPPALGVTLSEFRLAISKFRLTQFLKWFAGHAVQFTSR